MKSVFAGTLTLALLAGSLLAGPAAFAAPHADRGREERAFEHRGFEGRRYEDRDRSSARTEPRFEPHFWSRGEFLPVGYFGRSARIPPYAFYRLRPPPPGCAWVQVGDDFVLTAIATGLVVDVVHHLID